MLQRHDHRRGRGLACANVAVNGMRVEVDGIPGFDMMCRLAMPDVKRPRQKIKKLTAGMLMRPWQTALLHWEKLGEVRVELAVGNKVAQALEEVRRIVGAGLWQAHTLIAAMHPEQRLRLR